MIDYLHVLYIDTLGNSFIFIWFPLFDLMFNVIVISHHYNASVVVHAGITPDKVHNVVLLNHLHN